MDLITRQNVKCEQVEFIPVKILVVGDSNCGKSALCNYFINDQKLSDENPTIGVDSFMKRLLVRGKHIRLSLWDTSGHTNFADVRHDLYKDVHAVLFAYDVSSRESFCSLDGWLRESVKSEGKSLCYGVVACKSDLKTRAVTETEGRQWATRNGYVFAESSALTGGGVNNAFMGLIDKCLV